MDYRFTALKIHSLVSMPTLTVMRSDNIEFIGFALVYSVHRICSPSKLKGQLQLIKNLASLKGYLWNSPEADPGWGPKGPGFSLSVR